LLSDAREEPVDRTKTYHAQDSTSGYEGKRNLVKGNEILNNRKVCNKITFFSSFDMKTT